jgi:hypothetical protein
MGKTKKRKKNLRAKIQVFIPRPLLFHIASTLHFISEEELPTVKRSEKELQFEEFIRR